MKNISLAQLLFSPHGRIPRSTYWYYCLFAFLCLIVIQTFQVVMYLSARSLEQDYSLFSSFIRFLSSFSLLLFYPALMFIGITNIFIIIKRLHDIDWSGWYMLLLLIPLVSIVPACMIGFQKGTTGWNRYGIDPLEKEVYVSPESQIARGQLKLP